VIDKDIPKGHTFYKSQGFMGLEYASEYSGFWFEEEVPVFPFSELEEGDDEEEYSTTRYSALPGTRAHGL
jgi:hypothetical protein